MSMTKDYSNRQLVPRLLSLETSNLLSININSLKNEYVGINNFELHNYHKLKAEWKSEKNIIIATQMLLYEIIHDSLGINNEIITYLNKHIKTLNKVEKDILSIASLKIDNNVINIENQHDINMIELSIKEIKNNTKLNPYNSLQWCNLGYYYTKLGQKEKAKKAFLISIGLNNCNRHIVRSVARFFLHIGDIEFGHRVLLKSPRIKHDPSIVCAEMAFSELMGKKSKFIDYGIKLKNDDNISILEKNELLAQIATLEFAHGKNSKGKLLISECLYNPNENSLAQIAFLEEKNIIEHIEEDNKTVIYQFEALARNYFAKADFENALENAKKWHHFQPFCINPAALSTYIASSILGKYKEAIDIAKTTLKISPNNLLLLNNLAFSYARNNQIKEASEIIKKININEIDDYDKAVLSATNGYIAYKLGNIDLAKMGYNNAIKYFRNIKDEVSLARALYYYSDILKENEKENILKEVNELSKKNNIIELNHLLEIKQDNIIKT